MTDNDNISPTPESLSKESNAAIKVADDGSTNASCDDQAFESGTEPKAPSVIEPSSCIKYLQISGIVLASIGTLARLVKDLSQEGNIECFFTLCGLIAIGGILSRVLKEKLIDLFGAKLLATISLLLIPVFWGQFAAIIYAYVFNISADLAPYLTSNVNNITRLLGGYTRPDTLPTFLHFSNISLSTLISSVALGWVVIIPVTLSGIATLAPQGLTMIAAHIIGLGLLTCLPWRAGEIGNLITVVATLTSYIFFRVSYNSDTRKGDLGNLCAQLIPFVMTSILVVRYYCYDAFRSLEIYGYIDIFSLLVLLAIFFRGLYNYNRQSCMLNTAELLIALSLINLPFKLIEKLPSDLATIWSIIIPGLYLLLAAPKDHTALKYIGYNLLALLSLRNGVSNGSLLVSLVNLFIGIYLLSRGLISRDIWLKILGIITLAVAYANLAILIKGFEWAALIICGIAITFSASIAPRVIKKK